MQPVAAEAGPMGPGYQGLARSVPGWGQGGAREEHPGARSRVRRGGRGEHGAPWNRRAPAGIGLQEGVAGSGHGCLHCALRAVGGEAAVFPVAALPVRSALWRSGHPGGFCSTAHFLARKAWPRGACCFRGTSWSSCFFRLATWRQGRGSGGGGRAIGPPPVVGESSGVLRRGGCLEETPGRRAHLLAAASGTCGATLVRTRTQRVWGLRPRWSGTWTQRVWGLKPPHTRSGRTPSIQAMNAPGTIRKYMLLGL